MPPFRCPPLADLTRRLLASPSQARLEQVSRAEALHDQIDAATSYPIDFIDFRITGERSRTTASQVLEGAAVLPDLRQMIDALSRSVSIPVQARDPIVSPRELAQRLNVSTKTVQRWRHLGLRWRWVVREQSSRKQLGFTAEAVERFLATHHQRVQRAAAFSQIEPQLRKQLLKRARRIAQRRRVSPFQVAAHLSRKTGRALETIRLLLEQHDKKHPDRPIFVDHRGPLTPTERRKIARAIRAGVAASELAQQYGCTRSTVYRAARQRRAAALSRLRLTYITSQMFTRDDADEVFLDQDLPQLQAKPKARRTSPAVNLDDLPAELAPLYLQRSIDPEPMRRIFVRYNYLKYKVDLTVHALNLSDPLAGQLEQVCQWMQQARLLRAHLVAANLPVVLSMVRRHLVDQVDTSSSHMLRLLALGNDVLVSAVNQYDPWRPRPFSAYLTWQCQRAFSQLETRDATGTRAQRRLSGHELIKRMQPVLRDLGEQRLLKPDD